MTLILTLGNSEQVIQLSDRRLSTNGRLVDDESNKAGILNCANARFAYGFTGLARYGSFDTSKWLLSALYECGPPDFWAKEIAERLCERATHDFIRLRSSRRIPRNDTRLSVMFSGFLLDHEPPLLAYAIITNYQDFVSLTDNTEVWDTFRCTFWNEHQPVRFESSLVQRIGAWPAMSNDDEASLRKLLVERRPPKAIIGKAVELIREMADRVSAQRVIGKQISTVTLPRDINFPAETGYYSNEFTHSVAIPDMVTTIDEQHRTVTGGISIRAVNPKTARPMKVPIVPKKQPCPCGSGIKYKKCHGRN